MERIPVEFLHSIYMKIDSKKVIEALSKLCNSEVLVREVIDFDFLQSNRRHLENVIAVNGPNVMKGMMKLLKEEK